MTTVMYLKFYFSYYYADTMCGMQLLFQCSLLSMHRSSTRVPLIFILRRTFAASPLVRNMAILDIFITSIFANIVVVVFLYVDVTFTSIVAILVVVALVFVVIVLGIVPPLTPSRSQLP